MCGIAAATGQHAAERVAEITHALAHRGPDHLDTWADADVALGHSRLAIIDPTPRSDQPFRFRHLVVVYNGEIYNHNELRRELVAEGHQFATSSDTEVLAQTLAFRGPAGLKGLEGMFAFAAWDTKSQQLIVGRDRHGIKPLYWRATADGVEFASELTALTGPSRNVSGQALAEFLRFGSPVSTPIAADVNEVAPGTTMLIDRPGTSEQRIAIRRFTSSANNTGASNNTGHALVSPVDAIGRSIQQHAIADRPVALFLSGGFDAAAVLKSLRDIGTDPLCLTLATSTNHEDVTRAIATARHYGARHEVVSVDETHLGHAAAGYLAAMDQPTIDGFNTYLIAEICDRFDHPVALSGLGGDEVLGGYRYYRTEPHLQRIDPLLRRLPDQVVSAAGTIVSSITGRSRTRINAVLRSASTPQRHRGFRTLFDDAEVASLLGYAPGPSPRWDVDPRSDGRDQLTRLDAMTYLRPTLLRDADIFSMCHGVELRVPFVDTGVINSVAAARSAPTKHDIATAWADPFLMAKANEPKLTFRMPWQRWLTDLDVVVEPVRSQRDPWRGLVDPAVGHSILNSHERGGTDPLRRWALIVLAHWVQRTPSPRKLDPQRPMSPPQELSAGPASIGACG